MRWQRGRAGLASSPAVGQAGHRSEATGSALEIFTIMSISARVRAAVQGMSDRHCKTKSLQETWIDKDERRREQRHKERKDEKPART